MTRKILASLLAVAFVFSFSISSVSAESAKEEALSKAQYYVDDLIMSKQELYEQLTSKADDFSEEETQYAMENVEVDYQENAVRKAEVFYNKQDKSPETVERQMRNAQFTEDQIQYAMNQVIGTDSEGGENESNEDGNNEDNNNEGNTNEDSTSNEESNETSESDDTASDNDESNKEENESAAPEADENNKDEEQAEEVTKDESSTNDEEDETAVAAADNGGNDGSNGEEGGKLPETATSTFNWLLFGGIALTAGVLGIFFTRKKKSAA